MARAAKNPGADLTVPTEFPVMTQKCPLQEMSHARPSRKDAASGTESYPRFRMPYFTDRLSSTNHDVASNTLYVATGVKEVGIQTGNSTAEGAARSAESTKDRSREKLFRQLWSGLREHRHCIDSSNVESTTASRPSAEHGSVFIIYADGNGHHKRLSSDTWNEVKKLLFTGNNLKS